MISIGRHPIFVFSAVLLLLAAICTGFAPMHTTTTTTTTTTEGHRQQNQQQQLYSSSGSSSSSTGTTEEDTSSSIEIEYEEGESSEIVKLDDVYVSNETIALHHSCIKTRDIVTAIKFYGLLGFQLETKYLLEGNVRAAFLIHNSTSAGSTGQRLEFIEIPKWDLREAPGKRLQAMDLLDSKCYRVLGYNHVALDVTESVKAKNMTSLCQWIDDLNRTSIEVYGKHLKPAALECEHVIINPSLYDLAMIRDPDGCLVELLNYRKVLNPNMLPSW